LPPAGQLRFDWQQPVAAAVFRRAGRLWVAFDAPSQPDLAALAAASGGAVTSIRQLPVANATVLQVESENTAPPRLRRAGHAWIVAFEEATAAAPEPLVPMPDPQAAGGPRLVVAVAARFRLLVLVQAHLIHSISAGLLSFVRSSPTYKSAISPLAAALALTSSWHKRLTLAQRTIRLRRKTLPSFPKSGEP